VVNVYREPAGRPIMVPETHGGTMLIATFGPTTAWSGKTITRDGDAFVLEDHGSISAGDIMEYDRQGHLLWVNDGTRAWVGSRAGGPQVASASVTSTTTPITSAVPDAAGGEGSQSSSRKAMHLKRALLISIGVLVVANVVLFLVVLGVFRGP
jgi:hypothetical protein